MEYNLTQEVKEKYPPELTLKLFNTIRIRFKGRSSGEIKGGVFIFMVVVKKSPGDSDDSLIRKFSRKVISEGIVQEAKRREFYLKPSLARKQKPEDARRAKKVW